MEAVSLASVYIAHFSADAAWLKDVAPSTELRKWFGHDPKKWAEFQRGYQAELKQHEEGLEPILQAADTAP